MQSLPIMDSISMYMCPCIFGKRKLTEAFFCVNYSHSLDALWDPHPEGKFVEITAELSRCLQCPPEGSGTLGFMYGTLFWGMELMKPMWMNGEHLKIPGS